MHHHLFNPPKAAGEHEDVDFEETWFLEDAHSLKAIVLHLLDKHIREPADGHGKVHINWEGLKLVPYKFHAWLQRPALPKDPGPFKRAAVLMQIAIDLPLMHLGEAVEKRVQWNSIGYYAFLLAQYYTPLTIEDYIREHNLRECSEASITEEIRPPLPYSLHQLSDIVQTIINQDSSSQAIIANSLLLESLFYASNPNLRLEGKIDNKVSLANKIPHFHPPKFKPSRPSRPTP